MIALWVKPDKMMLSKFLRGCNSWAGFLNSSYPGLINLIIWQIICSILRLKVLMVWCCSDAVRTRQTLEIMQQHVQGFLEAEVHFISSFYSVAAMDGQTAEHLQKAICKYSRDEILTVMWVSLQLFDLLMFCYWYCVSVLLSVGSEIFLYVLWSFQTFGKQSPLVVASFYSLDCRLSLVFMQDPTGSWKIKCVSLPFHHKTKRKCRDICLTMRNFTGVWDIIEDGRRLPRCSLVPS